MTLEVLYVHRCDFCTEQHGQHYSVPARGETPRPCLPSRWASVLERDACPACTDKIERAVKRAMAECIVAKGA